LRRESLVQLDEIHLVDGEAGTCQRLADGRHRTDAHHRGIHAGHRRRDHTRQRRHPPQSIVGHEQQRRGASLMPLALPAVTVPPVVKAGLRFAIEAGDVSGLGCSSSDTSRTPPSSHGTSTGTISSLSTPLRIAAAARR
jgi:hypothetical protein